MDRDKLYEEIAARKSNDRHREPYNGGNGRIDKFLDLVRKGTLPGGGTVIDVGGSHGDLVELAVREGLFEDGCVIDISEQSVQVARDRGLWAERMDIDRHGLATRPDSSADCIVALDFIEHIVDPENFARECRRVLKDTGYVFINTPNISYWRHLESLVCRGVFPHTSGDTEVYHGGHLAFYNENDLERIFRDFEGNRQVHADTTQDLPPPIWRQLLQERGPKATSMLSYPNLLWSQFKKKL